MSSYLRFCQGKIFLSHCFVVSIRADLVREKFSPFSSRTHMIDNLSSELLVFLDRIGDIENTMVVFFETSGEETIVSSFCTVHAIQ